nr:hypothetical protein CFP56_11194 [Quercus suber]
MERMDDHLAELGEWVQDVDEGSTFDLTHSPSPDHLHPLSSQPRTAPLPPLQTLTMTTITSSPSNPARKNNMAFPPPHAQRTTPQLTAHPETYALFSQPAALPDLGMLDPSAATLDLHIGGRDFCVTQSPGLLQSARAGGTTGAAVWQSGVRFAEWLAAGDAPPTTASSRTAGPEHYAKALSALGGLDASSVVLELGAGVSGVVGGVLAAQVQRGGSAARLGGGRRARSAGRERVSDGRRSRGGVRLCLQLASDPVVYADLRRGVFRSTRRWGRGGVTSHGLCDRAAVTAKRHFRGVAGGIYEVVPGGEVAREGGGRTVGRGERIRGSCCDLEGRLRRLRKTAIRRDHKDRDESCQHHPDRL